MPHLEGVGTTTVFFRLLMRPKFWLHQRSGRRCVEGLPPCRRGGHSRQQTAAQFLYCFRAFKETPKVEETAVCSETDVDAV